MKGVKYFAIALVLAFLAMATGAQAQGIVFGVKPATVVQSGYFGFLAGTSIVLEGGLDVARINVTVKGELPEIDLGDYGILDIGDFETGSTTTMFMPHAGVKLYLMPRNPGSASPYFLADFFKAFTSYDLKIDAEDLDEDEVEDALEPVEEFVGDLLSPWGFNIAFGSEYHFSEHFSIGGEYGLRLFASKAEYEEADIDVSTNLSNTYTAITVNFAF